MNKTILLFFLVFLTETVLATVQRKDSVIYNGYSYHVDYDLMYDYFAINPQKQPNLDSTDAMYSSIYERYTIFEIEKGDIIRERALNTEQFAIFKEKLYQCFKETEEYSKLVKELSNKWNPRLLDSWLKEYAVGYMKKIIE